MNSDERTGLNNRDMLFTLLTALVKKNDGEIRISEDEMDAVTKKDMMMMYYNKETEEVILSLELLAHQQSDEIYN